MKIGILVRDAGASEIAYAAITAGNAFLAAGGGSFNVFAEDLHSPCVVPQFGMFDIADAYCFNGPLVATCISTASKLVKMPGPAHAGRFFYPWNLEWLKGPCHYNMLRIYRNPKLQLIARTKDYASIIQNCFNRECIGVADSCPKNLVKNLVKVIQSQS